MHPKGHPRSPSVEACQELASRGISLTRNATLAQAMPLFEQTDGGFVPIIARTGDGQPHEILGALYEIDALKAYNRALVATAEEEHS